MDPFHKLKFDMSVPPAPIDNIHVLVHVLVLVQVMALCQTGDKPFPVPIMTHFAAAYMPHSALMC